MNYFKDFKKDGFVYKSSLSYTANFRILASKMNWNKNKESENWQKLFKDVYKNELPEMGNYSEPEYFDYFTKAFSFCTTSESTETKFSELSQYMKWDIETCMETYLCFDCETYDNNYDYFYHVYEHHCQDEIIKDDFFGYFKLVFNFDSDEKDKMRKFWQLKDFIGLRKSHDDYEHCENDEEAIYWLKGLFFDSIGKYVDSKFDDDYKTLRKIILDYKMLKEEEIGNSDWCKRFIQNNLFVNIFDYASGIFERFKTLKELSKYSKNSGKIFPLAKAKETFAYKVLLREISCMQDDDNNNEYAHSSSIHNKKKPLQVDNKPIIFKQFTVSNEVKRINQFDNKHGIIVKNQTKATIPRCEDKLNNKQPTFSVEAIKAIIQKQNNMLINHGNQAKVIISTQYDRLNNNLTCVTNQAKSVVNPPQQEPRGSGVFGWVYSLLRSCYSQTTNQSKDLYT
jgi:hypothetical protein